MGHMPFIDHHLIDYQFGQMTIQDPVIKNPLLYLMNSFGTAIKTLAVRCLANAGASRDKNQNFHGKFVFNKGSFTLLISQNNNTH